MTIHRNEDHEGPSAEPLQAETEVPARPPYREIGYGHRAYKPDPNANYGFDPGPRRVLPADERRRWRVPG